MSDYDLNISDIENEPVEESEGQPTEAIAKEIEPQVQTFKYTANGKEIEEPIEMILKRASMGYNYAQHMDSFKKEQESFLSEKERISQLESKWKPYDEYAQQNPDWAEHVRTTYEQALNGLNNTQSLSSETHNLPPAIQKELSEMRQFVSEFKETKQRLQIEREDEILNDQIAKVKSAYTDIDFDRTNPDNGKSLEYEVLEHGRTHGINSFKAAFLDFYHDKLLAQATTKAKEAAVKELQERNKKGFIAESDTSFLNKSSSSSNRNRSYEELALEGAKELNIM